MRKDYNVVVIGAGAAGLVTAYLCAAMKAKVALIERHKMGGDCLNTGCVPSKAIIRAAKVAAFLKKADQYGFENVEYKLNFKKVMSRVHDVIKAIEPHDSIERYTSLGVECITGDAKILSPHEVEVNGKVLTTKSIVVATGAEPFVPDIKGINQIAYLTSETLWDIQELPKKLVVLGAGPIGSELAQSFSRLGSEVTMVERGSHIMPREDEDVAHEVSEKFKREGIKVLNSTVAIEVRKTTDQAGTLICEQNGKQIEVPFDRLLLAIGRKARVKGFGLENLGVSLNPQGTVATDEFLATTNHKNIFVCGDVAGPYQFTHVAAHQAFYAAINAQFTPYTRWLAPILKNWVKVHYSVIPWATYTDPEVATVGLTEKMAKEKGIPYEITKYGIDDLDRAIADSEAHGFVKVLTKPGTDQILGATIVGNHASDMITEFICAMRFGFGLNGILGTVHIYPTMSEANKYAAGIWKKKRTSQKLLNFAEKMQTLLRG